MGKVGKGGGLWCGNTSLGIPTALSAQHRRVSDACARTRYPSRALSGIPISAVVPVDSCAISMAASIKIRCVSNGVASVCWQLCVCARVACGRWKLKRLVDELQADSTPNACTSITSISTLTVCILVCVCIYMCDVCV